MNYDPGALKSRLVGLDFELMNTAFPTFSDLRVRQLVQTAGVNIRLTDDLVLNTMLVFNDYNDEQPYLYDATGKYLTFAAGVNWVF